MIAERDDLSEELSDMEHIAEKKSSVDKPADSGVKGHVEEISKHDYMLMKKENQELKNKVNDLERKIEVLEKRLGENKQ